MIIGKMVTSLDQFYAKYNKGFRDFELQLLAQDSSFEAVKPFIDDTMALGCNYSMVHTHLLDGEDSSPAVLDNRLHVNGNDFYIDLAFRIADYIGEQSGKSIYVILHRSIAFLQCDDVEVLGALLAKYKNVNILFESSSVLEGVNGTRFLESTKSKLDMQVRLIDALNGRAGMLFDLTHHSIDAKVYKHLSDIGLEIPFLHPLEIIREYGAYIKAVHLAYCFGNGIEVNHGVPFNKVVGGDYILATVLRTLRNNTSLEYTCLEIAEEDYTNPTNFFELHEQVERVLANLDSLSDKRVADRLEINTEITNVSESVFMVDFTEFDNTYFFRIRRDGLNLPEHATMLGTNVTVIRESDDYYVLESTDIFWKSAVFELFGLDATVFHKVL